MIRLEKISKSFGSKTLFSNISYHFPEGEKIALTGSNGSGKTTLLKIILKEQHSDSGSIVQPGQLKIGALAQEVNLATNYSILENVESGAVELKKLEKTLQQTLKKLEQNPSEENIAHYEKCEIQYRNLGGYELQAKAEALLLGLGFQEKQLSHSIKELSGGWQMRVEMAKMLINEPDFMILDEPTNHLDLPSLIWFEKYLQSFKGTLLFVSHDRDLLNRLSTITLNLEPRGLIAYKGNYDFFIKQRDEAVLHDKNARVNLEKKISQLQSFVTKFKAKASKASQAQSKEKAIHLLEKQLNDHPLPNAEKTISIQLPPPPHCDKVVARFENGAIGYTDILFQNLNFVLERGSKTAVIGANGIGKSTLLKTMAGKIKPLNGIFERSEKSILAYFSQNMVEQMDLEKTVIQTICSFSDISYQEARSVLGAFLFKTDDLEKKVKVLSGGEKNRLGLAGILIQKANFLLLDEPTNHLDMQSVECLIEAIKNYTGTVLFVSHNRYFINKLCSQVLAFSISKKADLFSGKIEDYIHLAKHSGFPNVLEENCSKKEKPNSIIKENKDDFFSRKQIQKEMNKFEKKIKSLEQVIQNNKEKIEFLEKNMETESNNNDFEKLGKTQEKINTLLSEIETHEEEWLDLSSKIEDLKKELV